METFLSGLLWVAAASFFVAWLLFAIRVVRFFRLRARLSKSTEDPQQHTEALAQAKLRVAIMFFAAFGSVMAMMIIMLALSAVGNQ